MSTGKGTHPGPDGPFSRDETAHDRESGKKRISEQHAWETGVSAGNNHAGISGGTAATRRSPSMALRPGAEARQHGKGGTCDRFAAINRNEALV
ncbi:MAG: hypothetical protein ACRDKS_14415, partial [Actinomycetota bacterium]